MKKFTPTLIAIGLFLVISFAYFLPILEGKVLDPQDIKMHKGMSKELNDYRTENGKEALWSGRYFSGGPSFLVSTKYKGNLLEKVIYPIKKIPRPASYLLLSLLLFYVMLQLFGVNQWLSIVGAVLYGFNSAFFIWIDTGHMSKALTITFIAIVVGGIYYAYNKKKLHGAVVAAFGLSWMINSGHPQITYYTGIMVLVLGITYLVYAIKEKSLSPFIQTSLLLVLAAVLAGATNYARLSSTMEYGKYSTRSQSELSDENGNKTSGLDKDYILDYSYDLAETVSAFIPRFKGGGAAEPLGEKSHVYKLIAKQDKSYAKKISKALPLYWGSQPISMAPFYFGAIMVYLFVFGLFVLRGKDRWWLAITVLVAFLLSLGKYLPALSNFMIDYFPGYNKFRDVKNIIVIQQFAMALTGILAIKKVAEKKLSDKEFMNALKYSFAIVGGFAFVFALIPSLAGNFSAASDAQMGAPELIEALQADRKMVLRADAFRSFIFVTLTAVTLWAYYKNKLKAQYALAVWGVLILADLWPVDKKYLNNNDFISKRKVEVTFPKTKADEFILKDKDPNYRVLNLTVNPFSDGTTSYYHKSIGGYHGAKLQIYQDLITNGIYPDMQKMQLGFKSIRTQNDVDSLFNTLHILNMLNVKYVIHNPNAQPILNTKAMGNAWFVNNIRWVDNADKEMEAVSNFNSRGEVVIDKRFAETIKGNNFTKDSLSYIKLDSYAPNKLVYSSKSELEQLAVFSEVYYPAGWKAKIDGKDAEYIRVNYILRGMSVPAGEHKIEFSFEPDTYKKGSRISLASSILLILAALALLVKEFMPVLKSKKE